MKHIQILIAFLLATYTLGAQIDSVKYDWGVFKSDTLNSDTIQKQLIFINVNGGKPGDVKISSPVEVKTITDEMKEIEEPEFKGYRVQIMLSQNKNDVLKAQSEFIKYNKEVNVYIDRKAPNYRLRAGNFYNKFDAFAFLKSIEEEYPNALVVSDMITFPKLKEKEIVEDELESQNDSE